MSNLEFSRTPWIVGHRGAAGEACENTLASFRRGLEARADMIELDVQMTRDGELVCFHDWTLERLAGRAEAVEETAGEVVTEITIAPDGSKIPTLSEALAVIPEDVPLNVEVKRRRARRDRLARKVIQELDGRSPILVSSFDWELLRALRKLAAGLPLAPIERYQPGELLEAGGELGAFSLHCHRRLVTEHFIERASAAGFDRVLAYTVNEPHEAERLLKDGVSGFFTDLPARLVDHFRGR
ncbi:MAG: glycerophosphodiester phosphodiesterase [bacterium]|nr:glycerophosphodiester phosphodiesterase [bacterium]